MRSAMNAASQLPGREHTDVEEANLRNIFVSPYPTVLPVWAGRSVGNLFF